MQTLILVSLLNNFYFYNIFYIKNFLLLNNFYFSFDIFFIKNIYCFYIYNFIIANYILFVILSFQQICCIAFFCFEPQLFYLSCHFCLFDQYILLIIYLHRLSGSTRHNRCDVQSLRYDFIPRPPIYGNFYIVQVL